MTAMRHALLLILLVAAPASATERRCGWLSNPTPGNWSLIDRAGEWTIGEQGGYQASGIDRIPAQSSREWVVTNAGDYGHGCVCLTVAADRAAMRIRRIVSGTPRRLAQCRADRLLPRP